MAANATTFAEAAASQGYSHNSNGTIDVSDSSIDYLTGVNSYRPISRPTDRPSATKPPMRAASATDGTKLAQYPLDAPPRWDGMAAANGRLLLSLANGTLVCLGEQ